MKRFPSRKIVDRDEWFERLPPGNAELFAMYASSADCIVTDPALMSVPVDDHLVHRGDGVFESLKCVGGFLYNLRDHLDRLAFSARKLGIELPFSLEEIADLVVQTVRAGGRRDALVRVLLSRGAGTMGVDPYACQDPLLYITAYRLPAVDLDRPPPGASAVVSRVPLKPGFLATVKSCNYLPNVLMKKEAADRGADFAIALDEKGNLAEGATENVGVVTPGNELLLPPPGRILEGTTARRVFELAQRLVGEGRLKAVRRAPVPLDLARSAREMHVYGTTTNITPIVRFEGAPVGDGRPGPVAEALFRLLRDEMVPESYRLTPVFEEEVP